MNAVNSEISSITAESTVLARYSLPSEDREVVANPDPGGVSLFDLSSAGVGEGWLIDRELCREDGLTSLVEEYVENAVRLGCPPASKQGIKAAVDALEPGEAEAFLYLSRGWS
jgi:hypothetical protein